MENDMKMNIKKMSILAVGLLTLNTSCSDFMEQPEGSNMTTEVIFSDPDMAMQALWAVYGSCTVNGFVTGEGGSNRSDAGTNDGLMFATCDEGEQFGGNNALPFKNGAWGPSNQNEFDLGRAQLGLRNACIFIDNVDKVPLKDTGKYNFTEVYRNQVRAEAIVLRALIHFEMMRRFGGIPIMDMTPRVEIRVMDGIKKAVIVPSSERKSLKSTIDFIVLSCNEALGKLPDSYSSAEKGRVTKGLALALKARTLLYAASPLFNTATPYLSLGAADSLLCLGNEEPKRWKEAADASKMAIDWANDNGYALVEDDQVGGRTGEGYSVGTAEVMNVRNREIIYFDHSHGEQGGGANIIRWGCPIYYSWGNCVMATPINYIRKTYRDKKGELLQFPDEGSWTDLKKVMRQAEPRLHETMWVFGFQYTHSENSTIVGLGGIDTAKVMYRDKLNAIVCKGGGNAFNTMGIPNGFHLKKFINRSAGPKVNLYWPSFRLSELYLNYVEALNEYDPGNDDIRIYLNKIRLRGGLPGLLKGDPVLSSPDEAREEIRRERGVELYAEEHRPFDVRRWKIADQEGVMKGAFYKISWYERTAGYQNPTASMTPAQRVENDNKIGYKIEKYENRVWDNKMYLYPFPQAEVNKGFLKQNPGWNGK